MESLSVLKDLVILLAAALAVGLLFERLRISAMLGYLVAGILVGPGMLGLVGRDSVETASEIGVALLLFTIGLETSWRRFRSMGATAAVGGFLQIALTTAIVLPAAIFLGVEWRGALVLGLAVSMSSTATVLQALHARGEQDSLHGRAALGLLLMQDGALVPLVIVTDLLGKGGTLPEMVTGISLAAWRAFVVIIVLIYVGARLMPRLLTAAALARTRELPIILAILACIGAAMASAAAGLGLAMGAFLAGMVLADSPLATQVRADVAPIRAILVTIFFVSMGMQAEPAWLLDPHHALVVAGLVIATILVKAGIVVVVLRWLHVGPAIAVATGLCMAQIGEFSFVLAHQAREHGLFTRSLFQAMATTTLVTLLLTPLLVAWARRVGRLVGGTGAVEEPAEHVIREPRVLLVGYGPAGLEVVEQLRDAELPVTVIDTNPRQAEAARQAGLPAIVGDASRPELLERTGLESALAMVITVPDHVAAAEILAQVRSLRSDLPVITRARHHRFADELKGEAQKVVDEEEAVGRLLGFEAYLATEELRRQRETRE